MSSIDVCFRFFQRWKRWRPKNTGVIHCHTKWFLWYEISAQNYANQLQPGLSFFCLILLQLVDYLFRIISTYLESTPSSFQCRIGALYALYAIYHTQLCQPKVKVIYCMQFSFSVFFVRRSSSLQVLLID